MAIDSPEIQVVQFGFIPVGDEERFRNLTDVDAFNGAMSFMQSHQSELRVGGISLGALVWHEEEYYDAISALTVLSDGLYRATSVILPSGETAMEGALTESHIYRSDTDFKVPPDFARPATPIDLKPFVAYGRMVRQAA